MKKLTLSFVVLLFFSFALQAQREQDSLALVKIYNSTGGPQWNDQGNWLSSMPISEWRGVVVSDNRVTELRLSNNLQDSLPPEIGNLTALTTLAIVYNYQLGGHLPKEIGKLTNLTGLDLSANGFTGTIPESFGNLKALTLLKINFCLLMGGSLPDTLGALTNLTRLILHKSNFSGTIPASLGTLSQLTQLDLSENHFSGTIPAEIGLLNQLQVLELGDNELSGPIPPALGSLKALTTLDLNNNAFSGALFPEIDSLRTLQRLYIGNNDFTSLIDFSGFTQLRYLDVSGNRLDFEDLDQTNLDPDEVAIDYYSQKTELPVEEEHNGNTYTLKALYNYTEAKYQWQKDARPIENATDSVLTIADSDIGVYDYVVTHPRWPDLTLQSKAVIIGDLHGGVSLSDSLALVDLYQNTGGSNWYDTYNWLSTEPVSRWDGISISDGRVTEIDLEETNLTGNLPSSIGNLTALKQLNLSDNKLNGNIPNEISNLNMLTALSLSNNDFSGNIPASLGELDSLEVLYLYSNNLQGTVPPEIGKLVNLKELSFSRNQLSGALPDLSKLTKLTKLWLTDNQFTSLSDFSSMKNLSFINVSGNLLDYAALAATNIHWDSSGYYYSPQSFRMPVTQNENNDTLTLTNSYSFPGTSFQWIKDNQEIPGDTNLVLHIPLTDEAVYICKARNPQFPKLELESNPVIVGTLHGGVLLKDSLALVALYHATNGDNWTDNTNWLSGDSVASWHGVSVENGRVNKLSLSSNNLTGSLPPEIGNLTYLTTINLWRNHISGPIPSQIGNIQGLTGLYLDHNAFSGPVPTEIGQLKKLRDIWLQSNQLSGNIPSELGNLTELGRFYADYNQLTGTIPASFGKLTKLYVLLLDHNQLSGSLPPEMSDMTALEYFEINDNELTGLCDLSSLPQLRSCYVFNNKLDFEALDNAHIDWAGNSYYYRYRPQNLVLPVNKANDGTNYSLQVNYSYSGVEYQWYKNNTAIDGETETILTFPVSDTGTYLCKVTYDSLPDLTLVSDTVILPSPVGIITPELETTQIYPNPAKGFLMIRTGQNLPGIYTVEIFNLLGRRMLQQRIKGGETLRLDLSGFQKGIYFTRIRNENTSFVRKIVVE